MKIFNYKMEIIIFLLFIFSFCRLGYTQTIIDLEFDKLKHEVKELKNKEWIPMLEYVVELHKKSTHPAIYPFEYEWEEIGTGYVYGPAFGHWDLIHQILDEIPVMKEHVKHQLLNDIKNQEPSGFLPGSFWMPKEGMRTTTTWNNNNSHPPVWMVAADEWSLTYNDYSLLDSFYNTLNKQNNWFENYRKVKSGGYFYTDITLKKWESGIDEGVRFDEVNIDTLACIDATCHVFMMYDYALKWAKILKKDTTKIFLKKEEIRSFVNNNLYDKQSGMFYDEWSMKNPTLRHNCFESL